MREHGMRVSTARRLMLEALYATEEPMTAEQVAEGLRDAPRSDLASVYRNLERLEEIGLVRHVHLGHGPGLYVRAGQAPREYLVCDLCGRVATVEPHELDEVRAVIARSLGWAARFTHFPISGLCPECRAKDPLSTVERSAK